MPLLLVISIVLALVGVALILLGVPYANRNHARLCPKCRYDLSATPEPPCPECGFRWRSRIVLTHRPARRRPIILGGAVLLVAAYVALPTITGRHWTRCVPRPVLAIALDVVVDPPPVAPRATLPTPDPNLKYAKDRWDRLVWQQQTTLALHHFLDRVEQSGGTPAEIEALVPLAIEANALYQERGGTHARDAWPADAVEDRARELRSVLDARAALPLGTWAASELQHFAGNSDETQWNWIAPPRAVLMPLIQSADPVVRAYALDRLVYDPDPSVSAMYDRLAESDPDPAIRQRARDAALWRRTLRGFP